MSKTKLALDVVQDLRSLADSLEALANAAVSDAPEPPANTATAPQSNTPSKESKLTLVELRAFVAERSTPENRPKIKALLTKHGVAKLTELPEEHYRALKDEVAAL